MPLNFNIALILGILFLKHIIIIILTQFSLGVFLNVKGLVNVCSYFFQILFHVFLI